MNLAKGMAYKAGTTQIHKKIFPAMKVRKTHHPGWSNVELKGGKGGENVS